jgi:VEFS-Box of polycomb protein
MKLWDRFVNEDRPQGNKHLPESLMRFVHLHGQQIASDSLRGEFWKFLLNMKQFNRVSNLDLKSVFKLIPTDIPIKSEGSIKPPKTPMKKPVPVVPSAITKIDEGSYCLCKSAWSNGMVCCSNEMCIVEWYHLACINLAQKPNGRWLCPK